MLSIHFTNVATYYYQSLHAWLSPVTCVIHVLCGPQVNAKPLSQSSTLTLTPIGHLESTMNSAALVGCRQNELHHM